MDGKPECDIHIRNELLTSLKRKVIRTRTTSQVNAENIVLHAVSPSQEDIQPNATHTGYRGAGAEGGRENRADFQICERKGVLEML